MDKKKLAVIFIVLLLILSLVAGAVFWFFKLRPESNVSSTTLGTSSGNTASTSPQSAIPPKVDKFVGEIGKPVVLERMALIVDCIEYSAGRLILGNTCYLPSGTEKLLVIRYTIESRWTTPLDYSWTTIAFSVADQNQIEHKSIQQIASKETGADGTISLAPGGKMEFITAIMMPADSQALTLIVRPGEDQAINYVLANKVKTLEGPFKSPDDAAGYKAGPIIPAQQGLLYPMHDKLDVSLDSFQLSDKSITGDEAPEGKQYAIIALTLKNMTRGNVNAQWTSLTPVLTDSEGGSSEWSQQMYKANAPEEIGSMDIEPDSTRKVREIFTVSKSEKRFKLILGQGEGSRQYRFDVP